MYNNNMIEYELSVNSDIHSWVIDSAATSHLCVSLQVMQNSFALSGDEIVLRMANGVTVAAETLVRIHFEVRKSFIFCFC